MSDEARRGSSIGTGCGIAAGAGCLLCVLWNVVSSLFGIFALGLHDPMPMGPPPMEAPPLPTGDDATGPLLPSAPPDLRPREIEVAVDGYVADAPLAPGTACSLVVEVRSGEAPFRCRAELVSVGRTLYGSGSSGLFDCELPEGRHVRGSDVAMSAVDGDAAFEIDTVAGTLSLRDHGAGMTQVVGRVTALR